MADLRTDERTRDAVASYVGKLPQPKGPVAQELLLALGPDESVERFIDNGTVTGQSIYTVLTYRRLLAVMGFMRTRVRSVPRPLTGVLLSGNVSGGRVLNLVADDGTPIKVTVRRTEDVQALLAAGAMSETAPSAAPAANSGRATSTFRHLGDAPHLPVASQPDGPAGLGQPRAGAASSQPLREAPASPDNHFSAFRPLVSWQDAHDVALLHMVHLGFNDAVLTAGEPEMGLAVASPRAAAQVSHQGTPVSAPQVQQLVGAAHRHEVMLFFASGGFTSAARQYADEAGVHLFHIDATGRVDRINAAAQGWQ